MSDLIDRQAAIDALNEYFARIGKLKRRGLTEGEKAISLDTVGAIKTLPPAQPEPHEGHWIWVAGDLECSKCHTRYPDLYPDYDNSVACPHCGYKMEVEHETD